MLQSRVKMPASLGKCCSVKEIGPFIGITTMGLSRAKYRTQKLTVLPSETIDYTGTKNDNRLPG